jgi:CHAT domain-containing protein/tetratricopeptide (TPR) repeat protein
MAATAYRLAAAAAALFLAGAFATPARALEQKFLPPPRTIVDVAASLDQDKPDDARLAGLRAQAATQPSAGLDRLARARAFYDRGQARAALGDFSGAAEDAKTAVALAKGYAEPVILGLYRQLWALQISQSGDPRKALDILLGTVAEVNRPGSKGHRFSAYYLIALQLVKLGDFDGAQAYARRAQNLFEEARVWDGFPDKRAGWGANVERARGAVFLARGQYRNAEIAFAQAESLMRQWIVESARVATAPPAAQLRQAADVITSQLGVAKARQGRLAEGEVDVRRALNSELGAVGRYNLITVQVVGRLADMLFQSGRYVDAETLLRKQLETLRALGVPKASTLVANTKFALATALNFQSRWPEAQKAYAELESDTADWDQARKDALGLGEAQIVAYYNSNNLVDGVAAAERLLRRQTMRYGAKHEETALARGILAIGLFRLGKSEEARKEFALSFAVLSDALRAETSDDQAVTAARDQRIQNIAESYMLLLATSKDPSGADESFRLADLLRNPSLRRALAASMVRASAGNADLAQLARKEQDLTKETAAQIGALNNLLSTPTAERDDNAVRALQAETLRFSAARDKARRDITKKFANFSNLTAPAPPTIDAVQALLGSDEAFLSFYFGRQTGFVWAVPHSGPAVFMAVDLSDEEIRRRVEALRAALESNAMSVIDIPPFDVGAAYDLYTRLLKPTESTWTPAKNLVVVADGALGLLPLGLLPTKPGAPSDDGPLFSGYRKVDWLARSHAVTSAPSAAAFLSLRGAKPDLVPRDPFIGFGNPAFSPEASTAAGQPETPDQANAARGPLRRRARVATGGASSAGLAQLPPLPDTEDELRAIASILKVDPAKVLHLGADANEKTVETSHLAHYRIVAFATHGLLPGDLDGLDQPALALASPDVAHVPGDGLLTMGKVLGLKLNADWVVLSACNSGGAAKSGAEAASGLGQAFFYAGARALLITNWSVHSASARDLVTDMFARLQANPAMNRAEALRQAMVRMVDQEGATGADGAMAFSYAHPLFWAPYTIIGDGGGGI